MHSLGEYIKDNRAIENINFSDNKITDIGIEILLPCFFCNSTLKIFDISMNKGITDKSIPLLNEIIEISTINDINIKDTSIRDISMLVGLLDVRFFEELKLK